MFINLSFESDINSLAYQGIGNPDKGLLGLGKYVYAFSESMSAGNMDYWATHLTGNYDFYFAGNTAYNPMDAGNFLWGVGMSKLGFEYSDAKIGSEVNAFLFGKSQNSQGRGISLGGDSAADQRAIRRGFFWNTVWRK